MRAIVTTAGGVERGSRARAHTSSQFKVRAECWHVVSGGVRTVIIALPPSPNARFPKAANDNGMASLCSPVSRQLVRRLLIASVRHVHDPYSMTSSARASNVGGTVRPSALPVLTSIAINHFNIALSGMLALQGDSQSLLPNGRRRVPRPESSRSAKQLRRGLGH